MVSYSAVSKLVSVVSRMLDALFCLVCTYFYGRNAVSHIDNPLLLQSASSLAKKLRHGEVSASEVVNAYIDRIREVNAQINAVVDEIFTEALREAELVDAELSRLRSGDEETANRDLDALYASKPFYGVPTSIKSTFAVRGASWHASLQSRLHLRADYDANEVARLRAAGFIVLCTTSVPELAMWIETVSTIRSRTLNPLNTSRCVGGSSGGEAALVAAGGAPVGLGSDLGGSIRIPSLFCGVFGHKTTSDTTTHHTDPVEITQSGQRRESHYPFSPSNRQLRMLSYGPICRYAEDLWPVLTTLLSKADRDRLSANGSRSPSSVNLSRTKFLYLRSFCEDVKDGPTASTYFMNQPDRLVTEAMDRVIDYVRTELHADIEPLRFVGDEFGSVRLTEAIDIFLSYIYLPDKIDADDNLKSKLSSQSDAEKKRALQASWRTFDGKSWLDYATVIASHSNCQAASRVSASVELLKKLFFWPLNLLGIDHPFVSRITTPILFSAINEKGLLARSHEWQADKLRRGELLERAFQQLFAAHKSAGYEHVIIICPVMPMVAPYHGKPVICSPFDVVYSALFNILGLPCTVAPILKDRSTRTNLPAAVQIVSDKFDDVACIAFAQLLERSFGGWRQPSEAN